MALAATPYACAMRRIVGISLAALLLSACNTATELTYEDDSGFVSIAYLKALCHGSSVRIAREVKIRGVVMAHDLWGEFPRTLVLEDTTAGIGVAIDHTALADLFPLGAEVTVYCTGLAVGEYGGKVQLGACPTGEYAVDRIARSDLERYLRCTQLNAYVRRPRTLRLDEIGPADADRYVRFEGIRFVETGADWCATDSETGERIATSRTIADDADRTFTVRTLPSAHYAAVPLPTGRGSINGIVDYFNGELSLRVIGYEVDFTSPAMLPTACPSAGECAGPTPTK